MSWIEEQTYFGLEEIFAEQREYENQLLSSKIWQMKNGKCIRISDMSDSHIINCINKIIREDWRVEYLPILKTEMYNRKNK